MISESEGLSSLKSDKGNNRFIPQPKRLKKDLCIVLSWLVRTLHWDTVLHWEGAGTRVGCYRDTLGGFQNATHIYCRWSETGEQEFPLPLPWSATDITNSGDFLRLRP